MDFTNIVFENKIFKILMQEYQGQQLNQLYKPKTETGVSYSLQSLLSNEKHCLGVHIPFSLGQSVQGAWLCI